MPLRVPSLQRRRLLFNSAMVLFLAFFAVAVIFSTSCKFQTACASSGVIDDGWSSLWGLKSPNESGSFSIDDRRENAVIKDEEDVIGPAYCPVCGMEMHCVQSMGMSSTYLALSEQPRPNPICRSHNLVRSIAYEGSAARLRRVIGNASQGRPTRIGVLGVRLWPSTYVLVLISPSGFCNSRARRQDRGKLDNIRQEFVSGDLPSIKCHPHQWSNPCYWL
jgi:hypothetical protein